MARYIFSSLVPSKFEYKLSRYNQRFRKIATTVVLDKGENPVMIRVTMTSELS